MFKVYYRGKLASEQEFATKKEAKKNLVAVLAGQLGKTVQEIMPDIDIEGNYDYGYKKLGNTVERTCVVCGKKFYVPSEKSLRKVCSDECGKVYRRKYNSDYHKKAYATDQEKHDRMYLNNLRGTKRHQAKVRWQKRVNFAEDIYRLAQHGNAKELIATYLDKRVISVGRRGETNNEFRSDAEIEAEKIFNKFAPQLLDNID